MELKRLEPRKATNTPNWNRYRMDQQINKALRQAEAWSRKAQSLIAERERKFGPVRDDRQTVVEAAEDIEGDSA